MARKREVVVWAVVVGANPVLESVAYASKKDANESARWNRFAGLKSHIVRCVGTLPPKGGKRRA